MGLPHLILISGRLEQASHDFMPGATFQQPMAPGWQSQMQDQQGQSTPLFEHDKCVPKVL